MIIDYNKKTGQIYGVINGRIHDKNIINNTSLSISGINPSDIGRIVVQWKPTSNTIDIVNEPIFEEYVDGDGFTEARQVGIKKKKVISQQYEPDSKQKDLFVKFDSGDEDIYNYKVNLARMELEKR
jgi:hypothetical protein